MGRLDLRDPIRDEDLALNAATTGPLTVIELEVLAGAARGETAKEGAKRLHRSAWTIADHRKSVLHKLGAKNMAHAVRLAHERGIFAQPERDDRTDALPINATKRDAFHAKCSQIDAMRELEPRTTKKNVLELASRTFGRSIASANDFTQGEARLVLDALDDAIVDGGDVALTVEERELAQAAEKR